MMSLTLVYSSRHDNPVFQQHLQQTCGVKYLQILEFNNPRRYSLSEIYNQALKQAIHDFIVFVHDDVIFETLDWGQKLLKHLQTSEFGILGVAGTTHLPNSGIWWQDAARTVGQVKHQVEEKILISHYSGNFQPHIIPVVCIDGVLMVVNRKKLKSIFNESLLGFHFYDIDFCIQNYVAGVAIGVIFDIKIIHRSIGQVNDKWEENRLKFINSHTYHLPCRLEPKIIVDRSLVSLSRYPKVTIIILHKSKNSLLFNCLLSIAEKSTYPNCEIIIADTGSSATELVELTELIGISQLNIKLVPFDAYHFGRVNNTVVSQHVDSELVLFCNNDIELINDAISRMVEIYLDNSNDCGTIGCRLHFANNTVQHTGIQLMLNSHNQLEISHYGLHTDYRYSIAVEKNILGSTAAFLLMKTEVFKKIGAFNCNYLDSLEDVELNLMCIAEGKINYLAGNAVCYHFESQTRLNQGKILQQDYQRLVHFLNNNPMLLNKIPKMR